MKVIVTMGKEKETKNTVKYSAEGAAVDSLYIHKLAMNGDRPESITVTIETIEAK